MDVSLGRPLVQMSDKRRNLIPCLPLRHQDRDERVPEGVVSVQAFKIRALDQLLKKPIRLVASSLFGGTFARALPSLVAPEAVISDHDCRCKVPAMQDNVGDSPSGGAGYPRVGRTPATRAK